MAKKADEAKYAAQVKASVTKRKKAKSLASASKASSAKKVASRGPSTRNKKALVQQESVTAGTRPSRKSTRRSKNHGKTATNLELREQRRIRSPQAQALRATAKPKRGKTSPSH